MVSHKMIPNEYTSTLCEYNVDLTPLDSILIDFTSSGAIQRGVPRLHVISADTDFVLFVRSVRVTSFEFVDTLDNDLELLLLVGKSMSLLLV